VRDFVAVRVAKVKAFLCCKGQSQSKEVASTTDAFIERMAKAKRMAKTKLQAVTKSVETLEKVMKRAEGNTKKQSTVFTRIGEIKKALDAAQNLLNDVLDLDTRMMDIKRRKQELDEKLRDVNDRVADLEKQAESLKKQAESATPTARRPLLKGRSSSTKKTQEMVAAEKTLRDLKGKQTKMSLALMDILQELQVVQANFESKTLKLTSSLEMVEKEMRKTGGKAMTCYLEELHKRTKQFAIAEGGGDTLDASTSVDKSLQKLSGGLLMNKTTYDIPPPMSMDALKQGRFDGFMSLTVMSLKASRSKMSRDTKELERVMEQLEILGQVVLKTTWDEVADLWQLMYDNYQKLGCERALLIIEQLFADKELRKQVGAARQLHDIANPDQPPDGVLVMLKEAKATLTKNMNDYVKAANREISSIEKVRAQQNKMIGSISMIFIAIATAIGNNIILFGEFISPIYPYLSWSFLIITLLSLGCCLMPKFLKKLPADPVKRQRLVIRLLLATLALLLLGGLIFGALQPLSAESGSGSVEKAFLL